ncbi:hypothetical protein HDU98_008913 [Podochytrium sp. JEL0797]|nr:hypothetical protein HDU98_008913 [Podochytrium sp. JEL0797]
MTDPSTTAAPQHVSQGVHPTTARYQDPACSPAPARAQAARAVVADDGAAAKVPFLLCEAPTSYRLTAQISDTSKVVVAVELPDTRGEQLLTLTWKVEPPGLPQSPNDFLAPGESYWEIELEPCLDVGKHSLSILLPREIANPMKCRSVLEPGRYILYIKKEDSNKRRRDSTE